MAAAEVGVVLAAVEMAEVDLAVSVAVAPGAGALPAVGKQSSFTHRADVIGVDRGIRER